MSMNGMDDYRNFMVQKKEPLWMREERYSYCEPYYEGLLFGKTQTRLPLIHNMLTRLFHN